MLPCWNPSAWILTSCTSTMGAFGAAPVAVRRVAADWRDRAERNPHRFNRTGLPPLIAAARERAAAFLGIDPSRAACLASTVRELLKRW